jgi:hypothetical protein
MALEILEQVWDIHKNVLSCNRLTVNGIPTIQIQTKMLALIFRKKTYNQESPLILHQDSINTIHENIFHSISS